MNLDMFEKVREEEIEREKSYKRKATKYYNIWVKNRQFRAEHLIFH